MCTDRLQIYRRDTLSVVLATVSFLSIPSLSCSNEAGTEWWLEIVREREPSAALIEAREKEVEQEKKEAQERNQGKPKEVVSAADKVIEKIRALFKALPKREAQDDGKEDDPKKQEARDKDAAGPVSVAVSMAGEVTGLNTEYLTFRPSLRPDQEIKVPLNQVTSVSRHASAKSPDGEKVTGMEFRVVLRDGSEIPGEPVNLTQNAITVALVGSEAKIDLPLNEITRIERDQPIGDAFKGTFPEFPRKHIAALSTGEIVAGQLLPSLDSDKWLRISSPILTAEVPLSLLDLLIFPNPESVAGEAEIELADEVEVEDNGNNGAPEKEPVESEPEPEPEPEPETEPVIRHLVALSPSGMLWANKLEVRGSDLILSALGKDQLPVPLERVESVSFGHEGLPATAPVLIWGGYTDEDDEYRKTIDAIDDRIPSRKLIEDDSKVPDAEFMRHLRRARVLLVPEMEGFKRSVMKAAMEKDGKGCPSWGEAFRGFLRRGGNVVFLSPTGEGLSFFNESGLGPLRSGGGGAGWEITEEGKKLGVKVNGFVKNVNSSHYYRKSEPWKIWGAARGGGDGAILLGRRVERGWVMVFGSDFYQTNDTLKETLFRLIQFNGRG